MDWVEQELPYGSLIFNLVRRSGDPLWASGNFVEDLCTTLDGIYHVMSRVPCKPFSLWREISFFKISARCTRAT